LAGSCIGRSSMARPARPRSQRSGGARGRRSRRRRRGLAHLSGPTGCLPAHRRRPPVRLHGAVRGRGTNARCVPYRRDPVATAPAGDAMAASRAGRQTVVHRRQRLRLAVGADAVGFNRAFAAAGFDSSCLRLSTLIDENTLAGELCRQHARDVRGRRLRGPPAALGARRARREPGPGADDPGGGVTVLRRAAWEVQMHHRHLAQRVYLAQADDLQFDVVARL